jgi:oxygen-independent coproporphyrinogen-3 oxidase
MSSASNKFGLYLHIPYCAAVCPYCDFAKTANFTGDVSTAYFSALKRQLELWLAASARAGLLKDGISSVFFGGGTPSLFAAELQPIMRLIASFLQPGAEVSLEANPDDLQAEKLAIWRDIGINRVSVGVQTFDAAGLKVLGRTHDGGMAADRVAAAMAVIPNLNVDLIYGWPGQTEASWAQDLSRVVAMGVPHLSLYCLTFEGKTPLGRQAQRGVVKPPPESPIVAAYEAARTLLHAEGYDHEEVSNWAKAGYSCAHNWLYWQDQSFIGVGAGAHGYLADPQGPGIRYAYPRNDRLFSKSTLDVNGLVDATLDEVASGLGAEIDPDRDMDTWLIELLGSGLRTTRGIDFGTALARCRKKWQPTLVAGEAVKTGILAFTTDGRLLLRSDEWFREAGWAVEVLRSCVDI